MNDFKQHPDFRLNGNSYNTAQLIELGHEYLRSESENERDFGQLIIDWFNDSPFVTVHTSGTTSTPKPIQIEKQQMINSARATAVFFGIKPKDKALLCMPTKYIAGKLMWVRAWVSGWHLDVVEPSANPLNSTNNSYDFSAMVPLQVEKSLTHLHRIKKILIGGAKLDDTLRKKLSNLPTDCYETYGMTETITHIAAKQIDEIYFSALPNVTFSKDKRGCLTIKAPNVSHEVLVTNDLVNLIDNQRFEWLGRIDNVINSGGIKVFPEKIENTLSATIHQPFFIAGIPDKQLGQKVVLIIEGKPFTLPENTFEALHFYERPKNIFFVDNFAKTPTGKVKRKEITKKLMS